MIPSHDTCDNDEVNIRANDIVAKSLVDSLMSLRFGEIAPWFNCFAAVAAIRFANGGVPTALVVAHHCVFCL